MLTFLASIFVCLMFGAFGAVLWMFWDDGSPENVKRLQDEEREQQRGDPRC